MNRETQRNTDQSTWIQRSSSFSLERCTNSKNVPSTAHVSRLTLFRVSPLLYSLLIELLISKIDRCVLVFIHRGVGRALTKRIARRFNYYEYVFDILRHVPVHTPKTHYLCARGGRAGEIAKNTNYFCRVQTTNNSMQYFRKENESLHPDLADDA